MARTTHTPDFEQSRQAAVMAQAIALTPDGTADERLQMFQALMRGTVTGNVPEVKRATRKSRYAQRDGESFDAWQSRLSDLKQYMREKKAESRRKQKQTVYDAAVSIMTDTHVAVLSDGEIRVTDTGLVRRMSDGEIVQASAISKSDAVEQALDLHVPLKSNPDGTYQPGTNGRVRDELTAALTGKFKAFSKPQGLRHKVGDLTGTKLQRMIRDLRVYGSMAGLNNRRSGVTTVRSPETGKFQVVPFEGYAYDPMREVTHMTSRRMEHIPNAGFSNMEVYTRSELMESTTLKSERGLRLVSFHTERVWNEEKQKFVAAGQESYRWVRLHPTVPVQRKSQIAAGAGQYGPMMFSDAMLGERPDVLNGNPGVKYGQVTYNRVPLSRLTLSEDGYVYQPWQCQTVTSRHTDQPVSHQPQMFPHIVLRTRDGYEYAPIMVTAGVVYAPALTIERQTINPDTRVRKATPARLSDMVMRAMTATAR